MFEKSRGIVLHIIKYNDSYNIVDIYTELHGRMSFAVKRPRSRKAAVKTVLFQPLSIIEFDVDYKPKVNLNHIREVKPWLAFQSLPYHPYKSAISLFIAEFLYRALREEGQNYPLFQYLLHSIEWLDNCENQFSNFHLVFLMRLSRFLGLYPNIEDYHKGDYFDLMNACFTSSKPMSHAFIEPEEAYNLSRLMRMNYETMHLFKMNRVERNRCLAIMNEYYRLHIPDFPLLKSIDVLQELFD